MMSKTRDSHKLTFQHVRGAFNFLWNYAGQLTMDSRVGDFDNWLITFRHGLRGMLARIMVVDRQYLLLHDYQRSVVDINPNEWFIECESFSSAILFGMDSALECFVFTLNAIGYANSKSDFCDITDVKALRKIGLRNLYDPPNGKREISGYRKFYPRIRDLWIKNVQLVDRVTEYHDVSKHRSAIGTGGSYGVTYVRANPKNPDITQTDTSFTLETVAQGFQQFIDQLLLIATQEVGQMFGHEV